MAKGLGKIILTSSILAGAALGSYMYFKKEGVIDETKTPAENAIKIRDKVTADAAEFMNRDRSYVDLNEAVSDVTGKVKETATEAAAKVKEVVSGATEKVKEAAEEAKDTFEPGLQADKVNAADSKTIGSTVSEEFFNDEA
ncbi:MAG: hypothetical protein IJS12_09090 [Lachnospiraceae bacterium]|nr:hypothetical protein [Lachnospiraceae bacterium]